MQKKQLIDHVLINFDNETGTKLRGAHIGTRTVIIDDDGKVIHNQQDGAVALNQKNGPQLKAVLGDVALNALVQHEAVKDGIAATLNYVTLLEHEVARLQEEAQRLGRLVDALGAESEGQLVKSSAVQRTLDPLREMYEAARPHLIADFEPPSVE